MNQNTRLCMHSCAKGLMKKHQTLTLKFLIRRARLDGYCSTNAEMNLKTGWFIVFSKPKAPFEIIPDIFGLTYYDKSFRNSISQQYENSLGPEATEDEEEAKYLAKRKMLGNIKFIGELGKLQIVHDSILHRYVECSTCDQLGFSQYSYRPHPPLLAMLESLLVILKSGYHSLLYFIYLFQMLRATCGRAQKATYFRPSGRS